MNAFLAKKKKSLSSCAKDQFFTSKAAFFPPFSSQHRCCVLPILAVRGSKICLSLLSRSLSPLVFCCSLSPSILIPSLRAPIVSWGPRSRLDPWCNFPAIGWDVLHRAWGKTDSCQMEFLNSVALSSNGQQH